MKLSLLSILLGVGMSVPQVYALTQPSRFTAAARKLPRNTPVGVALMLLGTAWFLWIVNREPIADFSAYKPVMMVNASRSRLPTRTRFSVAVANSSKSRIFHGVMVNQIPTTIKT